MLREPLEKLALSTYTMCWFPFKVVPPCNTWIDCKLSVELTHLRRSNIQLYDVLTHNKDHPNMAGILQK